MKRTVTMTRGDCVDQTMFHACRGWLDLRNVKTSEQSATAHGEIDCDANWPEHAARERYVLQRTK